jgi:hypothetical protein
MEEPNWNISMQMEYSIKLDHKDTECKSAD